jgi:hypothetical protein
MKTVARPKASAKNASTGGLLMLDPKARLAALRRIRGMWKNRKPDPIKELARIRKEWDRKLAWPGRG